VRIGFKQNLMIEFKNYITRFVSFLMESFEPVDLLVVVVVVESLSNNRCLKDRHAVYLKRNNECSENLLMLGTSCKSFMLVFTCLDVPVGATDVVGMTL
jgi:hypothetical protein